ncbi:MAG: hypothetical protein INR73_26425 [Williamsia sp.]|nr:hypothetical protein [Williamsia sp.]
MKYFLLGILVLSAGRLFSQVNLAYPPERWQEGKKAALIKDTLRRAMRPQLMIVSPGLSPAPMPTRRIENKGVFAYNNGRGFDVYNMKTDNMPCLVPDSTFHSSLPGARAGQKQTLSKRP